MAVEVFVQPIRVTWVEWNNVGYAVEPVGPPTWVGWGKGQPHPVNRAWSRDTGTVGDILYRSVHRTQIPADGKVIRKAAPQVGERV